MKKKIGGGWTGSWRKIWGEQEGKKSVRKRWRGEGEKGQRLKKRNEEEKKDGMTEEDKKEDNKEEEELLAAAERMN